MLVASDVDVLAIYFSMEEFKESIFQQAYWDIIKNDVWKAILLCFISGKMSSSWKETLKYLQKEEEKDFYAFGNQRNKGFILSGDQINTKKAVSYRLFAYPGESDQQNEHMGNALVHEGKEMEDGFIVTNAITYASTSFSYIHSDHWNANQHMLSPYSWHPPPPGWIKINIDAALHCSYKAGIGGILRDHKGRMLLAYGFSLVHWDIGKLEWLAVRSIGNIIEDWKLKSKGIIVEGDNYNVMKHFKNLSNLDKRRLNKSSKEDLDFLNNFEELRRLTVQNSAMNRNEVKHGKSAMSSSLVAANALSLVRIKSSPYLYSWGANLPREFHKTWCPPPLDWIKINVDASMLSSNLTGIGGVFRDYKGSEGLKLNHFIDSNGSWKVKELHCYFNENLITIILQIKIDSEASEDFLEEIYSLSGKSITSHAYEAHCSSQMLAHGKTTNTILATATNVMSTAILTSNPLIASWGANHPREFQTIWHHPPLGWIKINVDAALQPSYNAGIGGCFRDDKGILLVGFGENRTHWDIANLKLEAVMLVRKYLEPWMIECKGLIIEGDNINVIKFIQNSLNKAKWQSYNRIEENLLFLADFNKVIFNQIHRNCNRVADMCATFALDNNFCFESYSFANIPSSLGFLLKKECEHLL
ncbi:hypothetical protein KFK09_028363 [Dendrobium nobile]|uniref:RNase H type-1 domain-containing protein n=1 Tax=Dendrobium nobile TaxID=94219 RepID=A0A8T3A2A7_DENNO|nr:hypothetical protein KFK09_028363 [Dendrobium nobile]